MRLAEAYQKNPIEINIGEAVARTDQSMMDEVDPTTVENEEDIRVVQEIQPRGVANEGSTSLA